MLQRLLKQLARLWPYLLIIGLIMKSLKGDKDKISENFDFSKFDAPDNPKVRANIKRLVDNVLQPLRSALNLPIVITSGYRDPDKNKSVNGVPRSNHLTGQAADFIVKGSDLSDVYNTILGLNLSFDELILYRPGTRSKTGHIHITYKAPDQNRMRKIINDTKYSR
jgi:zinc D-Ala-D-Ala carboxypeptidase